MKLRLITLFTAASIFTNLFASSRETATTDTVAGNGGRKAVAVVLNIGASAAINAGLTEVLKHEIHEMRPDRSDNHSWPSRHTSWAFAGAAALSSELYSHSGFWAVGLHTAANAVAMQRCFKARHFPKDVVGGAAVGLSSTALGMMLSRLAFPSSGFVLDNVDYSNTRNIDATTGVMFVTGWKPKNLTSGVGAGASVRFDCPVNDRFGWRVKAATLAVPLYDNDVYRAMYRSWGLSGGFGYSVPLSGSRWGFEAGMTAGAAKGVGNSDTGLSGWSFTFDIDGAMMCSITSDFSLGAGVGYGLQTVSGTLGFISLSMISRVVF